MALAHIQVDYQKLPVKNQRVYEDVKRVILQGADQSSDQHCEQFQTFTEDCLSLASRSERPVTGGCRWRDVKSYILGQEL